MAVNDESVTQEEGLTEVPQSLLRTDHANAIRFVDQWKHRVRWVRGRKEWSYFDGQRWKPNASEEVIALARQTSISILEEASRIPDDAQRASIATWGVLSSNDAKYRAMTNVAQSDRRIWAEWDEFDASTYLLNFRNGTVDLRTGELRPHNSSDMISRLVPHNYDPSAVSPLWQAMVSRAVNGDVERFAYLQLAFGYALLGHNLEQKIFFLLGPEACGKSKMIEINRDALGNDYAVQSHPPLITRQKQRHDAVMFSILGKRYVDLSETDEHMQIDEAQLKSITGSSHMVIRPLFKQEINAPTTWTIFVATNESPSIENFSGAIKRRVVVIPCGPTIPEDARDELVASRILTQEVEGVLAWLVRGAMRYATDGFGQAPDVIVEATKSYEHENNTVLSFIDERCYQTARVKTKKSDLYDAYCTYHMRNDAKVGRNSFYARVEELCPVVTKDTRYYYGIQLLQVNGTTSLEPFMIDFANGNGRQVRVNS